MIYRVELLVAEVAVQWLNMPAAETEFLGTATLRARVNIEWARKFRIGATLGVAGAAGASLRLKMGLASPSADAAKTAGAGDLSIAATGPLVKFPLADLNPLAGAMTQAHIGIFGVGGDAAADPTFSRIWVEFYP